MKIHAFAAECNQIAVEHGFDLPTWENLPGKLMFIVSELDEAESVAAFTEFHEELADVAIRTVSVLQGIWGFGWADRRAKPPEDLPPPFTMAIHTTLWPVLKHLNRTLGCWCIDNKDDTRIYLEYAFRLIDQIAQRMNFSLDDAMLAKLEKNRARPRLHGKIQTLG